MKRGREKYICFQGLYFAKKVSLKEILYVVFFLPKKECSNEKHTHIRKILNPPFCSFTQARKTALPGKKYIIKTVVLFFSKVFLVSCEADICSLTFPGTFF